jgi:hypothetical protein
MAGAEAPPASAPRVAEPRAAWRRSATQAWAREREPVPLASLPAEPSPGALAWPWRVQVAPRLSMEELHQCPELRSPRIVPRSPKRIRCRL